jgi:uncharacterized membrane protein YraQ (UPF0718 family)
MATGRVGMDWLDAFGATGWTRPFAQATSFLLNVWHATMLGILISGLTLVTLPLSLGRYHSRGGLAGSLFGATFALPHPFCSCCSSVMASSFARRGASTNFLLSFVIGAPMLNITTVVLALALLPAPFAVTRIVAGLVVTILVTYTAARIADAWDRPQATRTSTQPTAHWWQPLAEFLRGRHEWRRRRHRGTSGDACSTPRRLVAIERPNRACARADALDLERRRHRNLSGASVYLWQQLPERRPGRGGRHVLHDLNVV